jgi:hypothetical protein
MQFQLQILLHVHIHVLREFEVELPEYIYIPNHSLIKRLPCCVVWYCIVLYCALVIELRCGLLRYASSLSLRAISVYCIYVLYHSGD